MASSCWAAADENNESLELESDCVLLVDINDDECRDDDMLVE